jgi:carboxypeptidase family protein
LTDIAQSIGPARSIIAISIACALGVAPVRHADAQAAVRGTVIDTADRPIADAEVVVLGSGGRPFAAGRTSRTGTYTIGSLPAGAAYRLTARKLGYVAGTTSVGPLAVGDTAVSRFILHSVDALAPVTVLGRRDRHPYSIDSTAIAGVGAYDALDALVRYPWMTGDGWQGCQPDTSHLMLGTGIDRSRPMPDTIAPLAEHGEPFRLFVDGRPRTEQSIKNTLAAIPADSIAEMHYVSCWDRDRPELRNSLSVILKRPSLRTSGLRSVRRRLPRADDWPPAAPDTSTPARDRTRAGVGGVVIDSLHGGRAFADALVTIEGAPYAAVTDSSGRYRIDDVPPGSYRFFVSHPLLDSLGVVLTTPPVTLAAGINAVAVITVPPAIAMLARFCPAGAPASAIVGAITDAAGTHPVAGAQVAFSWTELQVGKKVGLKRVPMTRSAVTDANGHYQLCDIPGPVTGLFTVSARGRVLASHEIELAAQHLVIAPLRVDTP